MAETIKDLMTPLADAVRYITDEKSKMSVSDMTLGLQKKQEDWDFYKKLINYEPYYKTIEIPEKLQKINFGLPVWYSGQPISITAKGLVELPSGFCVNCSNLTKVLVPNVKKIGRGAFSQSSFQEDGEYDFSNVETLEYRCFDNSYVYEGFISDNTFPKLKNLDPNSFINLRSASPLSISLNNIEFVQIKSFQNANVGSFSSTSANSINAYAFLDCKKLTSINIPNVDYINDFAFWNCIELPEISLPKCTRLGHDKGYVFQNCPKLKKITFGAETENFSIYYLGASNNLENIIFLKQTIPPNLITENPFPTTKLQAIYVPDEAVDAYKTATNWVTYADYIKPLSEYTEEAPAE